MAELAAELKSLGDSIANLKVSQAVELAAYLNARQIPGVRVYPTSFTPTESNFKGVRIEGVRFELIGRDLFDSTRVGLEVAAAIQKLYPGKIDFAGGAKLIHHGYRRRVSAGSGEGFERGRSEELATIRVSDLGAHEKSVGIGRRSSTAEDSCWRYIR